MAEYIKREEALMKLMQDGCSAKNLQSISDMPAADVAPVVHARWIEDHDYLKCPECGVMVKRDFTFFDIGDWNYCPNCGARMDEPVGNSDRLEENKE